MKKEQPLAIQAMDDVLSVLREKWINEKNPKERAEIFKKIDAVLDERIKFMKQRDAGEYD